MSVQLNTIIFALIILISVFGVNSQKNIGDSCHVARTGAPGTCRLIDTCPSAVTDIVTHHLQPFRCGFKDLKEVVCCPNPTTPPPIVKQTPEIANRVSSRSTTYGL